MATRRKRGDGSLRQRGPNKFQLVYDLPSNNNGPRRQRYTTFSGSERAARSELRRLIADRDKGIYSGASGRETVATFAERWLVDAVAVRVRPQTRDWYARLYRKYVDPVIGGMKLTSIGPEDITFVLATAKRSGLNGTSLRRVHTTAKNLFKTAVQWRLLSNNPVDGVAAPKISERQLVIPTTEQIHSTLDVLRTGRHYPAFMLSVHSGARRGEIAGLRWSAVDFAANQIRIEGAIVPIRGQGLTFSPPKTKSGLRTISLDAEVMEVLRQHRMRQMRYYKQHQGAVKDLGWVFTTAIGSVIDPLTLTKAWRRAADLCGVAARLHDVRHFHIASLLRNGVPINVVQVRAGHSSPMVTLSIYGHVIPGEDEAAATLFSRVMAGSEKS
ncbi:MAG: tyrosine-type recombinase/integrase [Chloroflexi bacterium]|nr:tyrosine-type recombinase/integrase [Chloroflexota bacterium]